MDGTERGRAIRALERLVDGQREALEVARRAPDGGAPAEEALVGLEDVLQGSLEDTRAVLGMEEEGDEA